MLREGFGMVPPKPVEIQLTSADIAEIRKEAERRQLARAYAARSDTWGRGLIDQPIVQGLVGELALIRFLNRRLNLNLDMDTTDRPLGDGGCDVRLDGLVLQVKTRRRRGHLLIRRKTDGEVLVPIRWDACICATWTPQTEETSLIAYLDGWIGKRQVLSDAEFKPARIGEHMNLELPDTKLQSMDYLLEYIEVCRSFRRLA